MLTFISGGARSGKSSLAEQLAMENYNRVKQLYPFARLVYLATAKKSDFAHEDRIKRHQLQRGKCWLAFEEPYDLTEVLSGVPNHSTILLDCLTVWTANIMYGLGESLAEAEQKLSQFLLTAVKKECSLYIVSNDVNEGLPSSTDGVQKYIYILESLHRLVIQNADDVIQAAAGIPVIWKNQGKVLI
ncbi:bifunctional adenosylcobinamide kinase/adenosylcobinamide-phosphate guanylyltransferase [Peribacillus sp. SCS-26]|uniref:bifunctional adenosylcobinamide kinase/adenosylcobinamide-phosphate guanylyltransferase n=1 Tax=Paraperibacillus marinus TaxID=3115295 RepID=UPI0039064E54